MDVSLTFRCTLNTSSYTMCQCEKVYGMNKTNKKWTCTVLVESLGITCIFDMTTVWIIMLWVSDFNEMWHILTTNKTEENYKIIEYQIWFWNWIIGTVWHCLCPKHILYNKFLQGFPNFWLVSYV